MNMQALTEVSAIRKQTLRLKTVTPLLMHGDNNKQKAQARGPSFKGMLRYWWRAIQTESQGLLAAEIVRFGGVGTSEGDGKVSPVRIHVQNIEETKRYPLKPHRGNNEPTAPGIPKNTVFNLELSTLRKHEDQLELYANLFELAVVLGGFGQRSRRGYGSLQIEGVTWSSKDEYIGYVEERLAKLAKKEKCIRTIKSDLPDSKYPVLRNIWIGKAEDDPETVLRMIGSETSRLKAEFKEGYALGSPGSKPASPLHVSIHQFTFGYCPVIVEVFKERSPNPRYSQQRGRLLQALGVK